MLMASRAIQVGYKIVPDFRGSARILDVVISQVNSNLDTMPLPLDHNTEALSKAIVNFQVLSLVWPGTYRFQVSAFKLSFTLYLKAPHRPTPDPQVVPENKGVPEAKSTLRSLFYSNHSLLTGTF
jgi:hypothetical protein